MKILYLLLITCVFTSCQTNSAKEKAANNRIKPVHRLSIAYKTPEGVKPNENTDTTDGTADEYATYYVVVADTGTQYDVLKNKMFELHQSLNLPIDTMGRSYNKAKDLIALPDTDKDEIYAGDYYPRRTPSNSLSLEYLNLYKTNVREKTIALIAGIFETKAGADSILSTIGSTKAFAVKASIYQGCLH